MINKNFDYKSIYINEELIKLFNDLKNKEEVNKDSFLIPIKPISEVYSHLNEFKNNKIIQKIILQLKSQMPIFHGVRGDGNCFYRSFALTYIEYSLNIPKENIRILTLMNFIANNNKKIIETCSIQSLYKHKLFPKTMQNLPEELLQILKLIYMYSQNRKNNQRNIADKLKECFNKIPYFDEGIIIVFRALAKEAFNYFKNNPQKDLSISTVLPMLEINIDEISIYGVEAEQIIIQLLSRFLEVTTIVNYIEKNQKNNSNNPKLLQDVLGNGELNLHIYYRRGHYDAGYCMDYAVKVYPDICEKNEDEKYRIIINELNLHSPFILNKNIEEKKIINCSTINIDENIGKIKNLEEDFNENNDFIDERNEFLNDEYKIIKDKKSKGSSLINSSDIKHLYEKRIFDPDNCRSSTEEKRKKDSEIDEITYCCKLRVKLKN